MKTIALIVAMRKELDCLKTLLTDVETLTSDGFKYIIGKMGSNRLILHQCGMGKVNAAVGASELIHRFAPDCIISSGVAGGLCPEAGIMHVVAASSVVYHDLYLGESAEDELERPIECDTQMVAAAARLSHTSATPIHIGQICTGDQFVTERPKLDDIKRRHPDGLAVDMESCAIAHACRIYGVPFISFRIISDTIGAEQHVEEYENFWSTLADKSFGVVREFLEMV